LIGGVVLLIAPFLFVLGIHFKLKHDVAAYKKQLQAKGEKLAISDFVPLPSTNGGSARELFDSLRSISGLKRDRYPSIMRMVAPGKAQVSWQNDALYDVDFKKRTNTWALIRNDFKANAEALSELRAIKIDTEIVFPVAYQDGFRAMLPHLAQIKTLAVWLSVATSYELHERNKAEAKESLLALLRFLKNYKTEPFLISHLVRYASLNIAFNTTWEALQYEGWSDSELKELQESWSAIPIQDLEVTLSMERAVGIQTLAELRESGENPFQVLMSSGSSSTGFLDDLDEFATELMNNNPKAAFKALLNQPNQKLWLCTQSYREELALLETWQVGIETSRIIKAEKTYQPSLKNLEAKLAEIHSGREDLLFGDAASSVRPQMKLASTKIAQQLAVTSCALHRYKLKNDHFPTELKQLIPQFLSSIPIDPIDGKPLRYRMQSDGTFLLYSVGVDGTDEGGDVTLTNSAPGQEWVRPAYPSLAHDWVWPRAATEAEVFEWEQHQPGSAK
jgi:hypothetical protein